MSQSNPLKVLAEMVAAASRTPFAQPDAEHMRDLFSVITTMLSAFSSARSGRC
jgi:hypothetical protein